MDMDDFLEPVEVYEAAAGNGELLAQRIESGAEMTGWERVALVAFLRGELVPPKRGRGQRTLPHLSFGTKEHLERLRVKNSVALLRYIMRRLKESGKAYGNFESALEHVAAHDKLSQVEIESVVNLYRRPLKPKERSAKDQTKNIVRQYQQWLWKTGRLPDYPQPVSYLRSQYILDGQPDLRKWIADILREEE